MMEVWFFLNSNFLVPKKEKKTFKKKLNSIVRTRKGLRQFC